ncbi:hypothetical protein N7520_000942 [Penicillium odoratum]|uniref:uncharacterized protein n=1 Tax=Penicillium odoratum TaxID=1167516 RepID=UPI002547C1A8|nr:uncharacterized protein N7520_000942 [Penicillium odoratum]KAJ5777696.1 hypothetical protein N7520_000942 [Penicillium odoratum]
MTARPISGISVDLITDAETEYGTFAGKWAIMESSLSMRAPAVSMTGTSCSWYLRHLTATPKTSSPALPIHRLVSLGSLIDWVKKSEKPITLNSTILTGECRGEQQ